MRNEWLVRGARVLRRATLITTLVCGLGAASALAATVTGSSPSSLDGTPCAALAFSQPFGSSGDSAWYTMVPGESPDNLSGAGWTLSGGASIQTTTLADGATGPVLDLPSGATAYSPPICIDEGFEEARTEVRDVVGSEGIFFYVQPWGTGGWGKAQNTGQVHSTGWGLSGQMNLNNNTPGWELVRFEFQAGGNPNNPSNFQMYDFWVDPKMCI